METNKRLAISIVLTILAVLCIIHIIRNLYSVSPLRTVIDDCVPNSSEIVKFEDHGFYLRVPLGLPIRKNFSYTSLVEDSWMQGSLNRGENLASIYVFYKKQKTPMQLEWTVELRVSVTTDKYSLQDLLTKSAFTDELPEIVQINHIPFSVFPISDAAMMNAVHGYSYRTIHKGKGYVLEVLSHGSTYQDENNPPIVSEDQLQNILQRALSIVKSFNFSETP
jgi:hypothetical protein